MNGQPYIPQTPPPYKPRGGGRQDTPAANSWQQPEAQGQPYDASATPNPPEQQGWPRDAAPGSPNNPYPPYDQWGRPGGYYQPQGGRPGQYGQPYREGAGYCRQPWQPYAPGQNRNNGMGTAGFVLSLVSIFIGWVPLVGWLIWILASVFSFIGLFRQPRGLAIAGIIISLVLIPMIVTLLVALDAFTSAMFLM